MKRLHDFLASLFLLAASASTLAAPTPASNLIVNGGFESNIVADGNWVNVSTIQGWTWLAGPGLGFEIRNNVAGRAQEGRNYVELDTTGNSTIGQYIDNLTSGERLDLTFWYAPREYQAASTNGVTVSWNGVQLGSVLTGLGGSGNDWQQYQYSVTALGGRNLLSFSSVGASDSLGGNLDNVSLNRVPEPGSLALAFVALSSLLVLRRRQVRTLRAERRAAP